MLVSKKINIEMAHKLSNYNGGCNNIHGHRMTIEIGVEGDIINAAGTSEGMVVDYKILKQILNEVIHDKFDHSMTVYKKDNTVPEFKLLEKKGMKVNFVDYNPTSENFAKKWFVEIQEKLKEEVTLKLSYIIVWETETAYTTYMDTDFKRDKPKGQKNLFEDYK